MRIAFLVGALLSATATAAFAAEDHDEVAAQMYRKYCGACHGLEGKGDGVVSGFMQPHPSDLTQLSKMHGGEFPFAYVMRTIDGRQTIASHGDTGMPVWGEILKEEAGDDLTAETEVRGKILLITEYLRRIQQTDPPSSGTE